jgi:hypothetical protein
MGGLDKLTGAQHQLAKRAATLAAECERVEDSINQGADVDFHAYGQLVDRLGRCLQRIAPDLSESRPLLPANVKIEHVIVRPPSYSDIAVPAIDVTPVAGRPGNHS